MIAGLIDAVRPEGDTAVASVTLPMNPPRLLTLMVAAPDWPANSVTAPEFVETEKSTTVTVIWTEWVREPLVAVTVIV